MSEYKADKMKGKLKEVVGDITGDKDMKREGQVDQGAAAIKTHIDKAANKVKDTINPEP